jgi:hypothetical protein
MPYEHTPNTLSTTSLYQEQKATLDNAMDAAQGPEVSGSQGKAPSTNRPVRRMAKGQSKKTCHVHQQGHNHHGQ